MAQAVVHFEPAFEALVPAERRHNEYTRSNWVDNYNFAYKRKSRAESIAKIEGCRTNIEVADMMSPGGKMWGFNFDNIKHDLGTIEFRRGAASLDANDVYKWVEIAVSFLFAAMKLGSPGYLATQQPTVGGLRAFIASANLQVGAGMHDVRYLDHVFAGKDLRAALQPQPVGKLTPEKEAKLQKKIAADRMQDPMRESLISAQHAGA